MKSTGASSVTAIRSTMLTAQAVMPRKEQFSGAHRVSSAVISDPMVGAGVADRSAVGSGTVRLNAVGQIQCSHHAPSVT